MYRSAVRGGSQKRNDGQAEVQVYCARCCCSCVMWSFRAIKKARSSGGPSVCRSCTVQFRCHDRWRESIPLVAMALSEVLAPSTREVTR